MIEALQGKHAFHYQWQDSSVSRAVAAMVSGLVAVVTHQHPTANEEARDSSNKIIGQYTAVYYGA